jgi:K+-sensing histidine kinase KdpD
LQYSAFGHISTAATLTLIQKRRHANALEEKINEIRIINDKLTQSETHLKQTVQTKDKLFSIIAHDLRSPFTALVGLSEVLANNAKHLSPEEICEYSMHINKSATEVLSLTDNLLSWSRSHLVNLS